MLVSKAGEDDLLHGDLDPLNDDDFVVILGRLALDLEKATERESARALRDALDAMDVAWASLSVAAADRIIEGARAVLAGSVEKIIPRTSRIFQAAARAIIPATKANLIEQNRLQISPGLNAKDKKTGEALLRHQGLYLRDEYGRRADAAVDRARKIIADGIERGLPQDEITSRLATDITLRQLGRARSYWEVVATAFSNTARTSTQINSFAQAGVTTYRLVAVIDDRTTDFCRYMDGRVFTVSSAAKLQNQAERSGSADELKQLKPWVSRGREDGRSFFFYEKAGKRVRVAEADEEGNFIGGLDTEALEDAGLLLPPFHARCRTTCEVE